MIKMIENKILLYIDDPVNCSRYATLLFVMVYIFIVYDRMIKISHICGDFCLSVHKISDRLHVTSLTCGIMCRTACFE